MIKFKFKLKQKVSKNDKHYIIIGKMGAIEQPNRYMLQDINSYEEKGYRFDKAHWEYEHKLTLIK